MRCRLQFALASNPSRCTEMRVDDVKWKPCGTMEERRDARGAAIVVEVTYVGDRRLRRGLDAKIRRRPSLVCRGHMSATAGAHASCPLRSSGTTTVYISFTPHRT